MGDPENLRVLRHDNSDDFYRCALDTVVSTIKSALSGRGACSIALSGGKTPGRLLNLLSENKNLNWDAISLFWVDERCVPHDHLDSNFGLVQKKLLSKISIPKSNVHGIETEVFSPGEASYAYEQELKKYFKDQLPAFDLVLLGMGGDGHTASLFPGEASLSEQERWVIAVDGRHGDPPIPRVTLTLPVINNAECALFLVAGEDKAELVEEIVKKDNGSNYPAGLVCPKGDLIWCVFNKDLGPRT